MANENDKSTNVEKMLEMLKAAAKPGGPSALCIKTHLKPAGGFDRLVAPAKYSDGGKGGCYVFEQRYLPIDWKNETAGSSLRTTVLMDSRESNANRLEEAIGEHIEHNPKGVFAKMPKIKVTYSEKESYYDYQLPHRAFDAHVRFGIFDNKDSDKNKYIAAMEASPKKASALLDISAITVLLGGWDSHGGGAKFPTLVVGEAYGVLPGNYKSIQKAADEAVRKRHGARIDPFSSNYCKFSDPTEAKADEKKIYNIKCANGSKEQDESNASKSGIGNIGPECINFDGVAVEKVVRNSIVQFGAIRQLHFGKTNTQNEAIRVLLGAMAINAVVYANQETYLRANAQLLVTKNFDWECDGYEKQTFNPLTPEEADELLEKAYMLAENEEAIDWSNVNEMLINGSPEIKKSKDNAKNAKPAKKNGSNTKNS